MKKIWEWVLSNSSALQGVASILVILTALCTGFIVLSNSLKPDILIQLDVNESTFPDEILSWIHDAKIILKANKDSLLNDDRFPEQANKVFNSEAYDRLQSLWGTRTEKFGKLKINVVNQSEEIISGVRLRIEGVRYLWNLALEGTFLTEHEKSDFLQNIEPLKDYDFLVLPQLPSLPPKSVLDIDLYGSIRFADVIATIPGKTVKIEKMAKVENSWIIDIYQHPYKLILYSSLILPILTLILFFAWVKLSNTVVQKSTPGILYNIACEKALAGDDKEAILFLEYAFNKGYSDKMHVMKDPDLISLREKPEFRKLISTKDGT